MYLPQHHTYTHIASFSFFFLSLSLSLPRSLSLIPSHYLAFYLFPDHNLSTLSVPTLSFLYLLLSICSDVMSIQGVYCYGIDIPSHQHSHPYLHRISSPLIIWISFSFHLIISSHHVQLIPFHLLTSSDLFSPAYRIASHLIVSSRLLIRTHSHAFATASHLPYVSHLITSYLSTSLHFRNRIGALVSASTSSI